MQQKYILVALLLVFVFPICSQSGEVANNTTSANRILLKIPYEDREDLLHVMRNNLKNLGKMIGAMSNDDFTTVQEISEKMSFNKKKGKGLAHRGNKVFTAMGVQFHAVDTISVMKAAQKKDRKATLKAMSNMVDACVACHSTFRVMEWPDDKVYERPKPTKLILPKDYKIKH